MYGSRRLEQAGASRNAGIIIALALTASPTQTRAAPPEPHPDIPRNMEAERINALAGALTDLNARSLELRRYL